MVIRLFSQDGRTLKRDSGENVEIYGCPFTEFYKTKETQDLSQKYDIGLHIGTVPSSLGSSGRESAVADLFKTYQFVGGLCGVLESELETFAERTNHKFDISPLLPNKNPAESKLFKRELIEGNKVIFPTEALLINQRVQLRDDKYYLTTKKL